MGLRSQKKKTTTKQSRKGQAQGYDFFKVNGRDPKGLNDAVGLILSSLINSHQEKLLELDVGSNLLFGPRPHAAFVVLRENWIA